MGAGVGLQSRDASCQRVTAAENNKYECRTCRPTPIMLEFKCLFDAEDDILPFISEEKRDGATIAGTPLPH